MSATKLLAPVGAGEQFPGMCLDLSVSAYAESVTYGSDPTQIPPLSDDDFDIMVQIAPASQTAGTIFAIYNDANNFVALYLASTAWNFIWKTQGTNRILLTLPYKRYGCYTPVMVTRRGNTFKLAHLSAFRTEAITLESVTADIAAGDTFDTDILASAAVMRLSHRDGTTSTHKVNGAMGPLIFVTGGGLDSYTDGEQTRLMQDPQRYFSHHEYAASKFTAYGNVYTSGDVLREPVKRETLTTGDKIVCPFSGRELIVAQGGVDYLHPPYTIPSLHYPNNLWMGSYNHLDKPEGKELPDGDGWVTYHVSWDAFGSPHLFLAFCGSDGKENRIPVQIPWAFTCVDSSNSHAKLLQYMGVANFAIPSDSHVSSPVIFTPDGLITSVYLHSDSASDSPDTGDHAFEFSQFWRWQDDTGWSIIEPYTGAPFGTATAYADASYLRGLATYSTMARRGDKVLISQRSGSATGAQIVMHEVDPADLSVVRQPMIDSEGVLRNYLGQVVNTSDGRSIAIARYIKGDSSSNLGYSAIIVPPSADLADSSKWFAPDGTALGAELGDIDQLDLSLHITSDNDSFFPSLPANSAGMQWLRGSCFSHVNRDFEGLATIMQVADWDGGAGDYTYADGPGATPYTDTPVFDAIELRRWTYTPGATPTLVEKDSRDISALAATWLTGNWAWDAGYPAWKIANWPTMYLGTNMMLIFVIDQLATQIDNTATNYWWLSGFQIRGVLAINLGAADINDVEFLPLLDPIYTIETDGSEGENILPYAVGNANDGSKSVLVAIGGGDVQTQGFFQRTWRGVDLRDNIRATLAASNKLVRRRSGL